MDFIKRIVILTSIDNEENKGYLTLNKKNGTLKCQLKTFFETTNENHILAISIDDKPLSNIYIDSLNANEFNFTLNENLNIENKVNALVFSENTGSPLLFGSTAGDDLSKISSLQNKKSGLAVEASAFSKKHFETSEKEEEKLIEENLQDDDVPFFNLVKPQIDEMFETYPEFPDLQKLVAGSKWVKVDYDNDGLFYALGLIYEEDEIKYICYAVPGENNFNPPEQIASYCQWLASEENGENGYFIMYQDAMDGTSLKK